MYIYILLISKTIYCLVYKYINNYIIIINICILHGSCRIFPLIFPCIYIYMVSCVVSFMCQRTSSRSICIVHIVSYHEGSALAPVTRSDRDVVRILEGLPEG